MKQRLIILRGAPSSGKTTIAKSFRDFDQKIAWLKVDNFKDFFAYDASKALTYVNGAAIATLEFLLKNNFSVVMDGIFQDTQTVDDAFKIAESLKIPCRLFELEVALETLLERDKIRAGVHEGLRPALGDKTITKIYNTLKNNSYPNSIKLNTENNTIEECKEIINKTFD